MNLFVSADFWSSSLTRLSTSDSKDLPTWRKTTPTAWTAALHTWDRRFLTLFNITFLTVLDSDSRTWINIWLEVFLFGRMYHLCVLIGQGDQHFQTLDTFFPIITFHQLDGIGQALFGSIWKLSDFEIIFQFCYCRHSNRP